MKLITWLFVGAAIMNPLGVPGMFNKPKTTQATVPFAEALFFSKGGLGIIRPDLYVVVKSDLNEIRLSAGREWRGQAALAPEVAIFFDDKIWAPQTLPAGFDLSRAVIISFETDKVRFFDFSKMSGGYYRRIKPEPST